MDSEVTDEVGVESIRPSPEVIESTWTTLFNDPLLSLSRIRAAALGKLGIGESQVDGGITLRSVYWRIYHGLLPPPTSLDLFPPALAIPRATYSSLRRRYLIAPDGRWADDCSPNLPEDEHHISPTHAGPSSRPSGSPPVESQGGGGAAGAGAGGWDPLSLDEESPWKSWYAQLELRKMIRQDVDRTFPDIPYFTMETVRKNLVTILFLFAMINPDVGYRQGMHELLAVCFLTVDRDSLVPPSSTRRSPLASPRVSVHTMQEAMYATLDRRFVEHDAFELFAAIMKAAKSFYEWRAEEGPLRARGSSAATKAPIITRCDHIHSSLVRRIDPQLWERLETEGVEAQIWAIRWIKLILTRELPFHLALRLWDGIFAEDPGLRIVDFVCVAMLLLIRNELLDSDHAGLLTNLLRFPAPSINYPFSPFLILSQAFLLRNSITPATGVEVVIQNQEMLGVRAQPPERAVDEIIGRKSRGPRGGGPGHRGRPAPPKGMQGIAAGLYERAQAAGLDKAFMSTVADLRRNLPDSSTAYSYFPNLPFSPSQSPAQSQLSGAFPSIPSSSSALPDRLTISSPTTEYRTTMHPSASGDSVSSAKTLRDAEREVAELRLAMVCMGKAMAGWMSGLPEDVGDVEKAGLGRIRDTLLDGAGKVADEMVKEWTWDEGSLEVAVSGERRDELRRSEEGDKLEAEVEGGSGQNDKTRSEITPTQRPVPKLLPGPHLVSKSPGTNIRSAPLESGPSRPPLYLSTREDGPMASLPRVPVSAPIRPSSKTPRISHQGPHTPIVAIDGDKSPVQRDDGRFEADPLAGLGVSAASPDLGRRPGSSSSIRGRPSSVDPLLGMGLR